MAVVFSVVDVAAAPFGSATVLRFGNPALLLSAAFVTVAQSDRTRKANNRLVVPSDRRGVDSLIL